MINISESLKSIVKGEGRTFRTKLIINEKEYTEFSKCTFRSGVENNESISLGSTFSAFLNTTLADVPSGTVLKGNALFYIGVMTDTDKETFEDIKIATLNIDSAKREDSNVVIVAYDNFYKTEVLFTSDFKGETPVDSILQRIAEICDITVSLTGSNIKYPLSEQLNGLTCREVIGYMASFLGKNARFNPDGELELVWYADAGEYINADRFSSPLEIGDQDIVLEKLVCNSKIFTTDEEGNQTDEDKVFSSGSGEGITFSNMCMTDIQFNSIYSQISGFTFRNATVNWLMAEPHIQAGDIITVTDINNVNYTIPVMELELNCDGGLSGTILSKYTNENQEEFSFQGPLTKQVERTYAELGTFKKVMVDEIKGINADFVRVDTDILNVNSELTALKGTIQDLDVETIRADVAVLKETKIGTAEVETLLADKGYLTEVKAEQVYSTIAEFEILNAKLSNIDSLLAGNVSAESGQYIHLTSKNTVIENALIKDSMVDSLSFNKLTGIDINTTQLTIHSDDGKSTWIDNTIQIKDDTRTRVQIGKDSQGDYNIYIWDAEGNLQFDPLGLTEYGVNREVIDNSNVKENAAIHGSKLDIDSVVVSINGSTETISSSKIWVDEENLSLGAKFNEISSSINEKTSVEQVQEAIKDIKLGTVNLIRNAKTMIYSGYGIKGSSTAVLGEAVLGSMLIGIGIDKTNTA